VSRGLLALLDSEDELAGVLGHEIGHVAARHAVRRVTRGTPLAVVTGIGAAVTGIVSPALGAVVGGIGDVANAAILAPYSRDQEREADRIGQEIAARAGWDPAGLSRALDTLAREEALAGNRGGRSFLSTHPALPERVTETETHAAALVRGTGAPIAAGRDGFLRRLDGLVVGPGAANGVFDGPTFRHPDLDFQVRFPSGWKTANERDVVGAGAPDGRAVAGLELVGQGSDPVAAAQAFARELKVDLGAPERFTVGGLPAAHSTAAVRTRDGRVDLDLTWIAHAGRIFQLTGATPAGGAEAARPLFRETAASFRPLTAAERAGIREARVRLVAARAGDSLATLVARTPGPWSPDMTAVANGLEAGAPVRAGTLVKLAVDEPYAPPAAGR
jgi:predicted Zn-dependent protease